MSDDDCKHEAWEAFPGGERRCADCGEDMPAMVDIDETAYGRRVRLLPALRQAHALLRGMHISWHDADAVDPSPFGAMANAVLEAIAMQEGAALGGRPVWSRDATAAERRRHGGHNKRGRNGAFAGGST